MNVFSLKTKLCIGEDALVFLHTLPDGAVVVITDSYMVRSGIVQTVTKPLEDDGRRCEIFSDIEAEPSVDTVAAGVRMLLSVKPAAVVALGGGAAMDAAKAMVYFCRQLRQKEGDVFSPLFIAVPTTSGTGSEVTSYAVIHDTERGVKIPLSHESMLPDVAVLDPNYTRTLPPAVIANTGMDVLTHAIEAFVSPAANDFTDMYAAEAVRLCLENLSALYTDAAPSSPRGRMHSASTMAGIAFTNAGLGLCHGIAHTVGAMFHLPHGKANAVILPYVMLFNAGLGKCRGQGVPGRYAALALRTGFSGPSEPQLCRQLIRTVCALRRSFDIPASFAGCGIGAEEFSRALPEMVGNVQSDRCTQANPVPVGDDTLSQLLRDIFDGRLEV